MSFYFIFINYFIVTMLFLYGLFLQNISQFNKRSLFYGVRIPIGFETNEKLVLQHKKYQKYLTLCFIIFLILLTVILRMSSEEMQVIIIAPETFIWLSAIGINYLLIHRRIKQISLDENWTFENNVVVIDTNYRENYSGDDRIAISSFWYLIPLSILLVTIAGIVLQTTAGNINASLGGFDLFDEGLPAIIMIFTQAFLNLCFYINHIITKNAKQSLNGGKVGEIKYRSRKIRYIVTAGLFAISVYINLVLMLVVFSMCKILSQELLTTSIFISIIIPFIISAVMIFAIHKVNKEVKYTPKSEAEAQIVNRSDDQYYLFGSIYYNKNDPALFVEKRLGIGFTLNLAKPAAKVFMSIIGLIVIGSLLLVAFLPGFTKERQVDVSKELINVSGAWGPEITLEQIDKIALENNLPGIITKTNGADIGDKLYGHHKLIGYENSILFLGNKNRPYLAIYLKDGGLVLINYDDASKTELLYEKVNSIMNMK